MNESKKDFSDIKYMMINLEIMHKGEKKMYERAKRALDIIFSILGSIVALPLVIVFGTLVKLESPGNVIFKQKRIGIYGRIFTIYKLRSMYTNRGADIIGWTEKNDPRVTRIGRFIRRARIDELPQIINILKGEMSIIGPRPEVPELTYEFEREIPGFINRLIVKPGLTGLAQVNGGYDITPAEKLKLDMEYINKRNILMDAVIMIKTFKVVFGGAGAR